mmetsp:Transcript_113663/g.367262  ORF Transcript_113663/g.367262 Transcript_113663/m.367262 type:complete len:206 (-) Transcript_113663:610-1227(-)
MLASVPPAAGARCGRPAPAPDMLGRAVRRWRLRRGRRRHVGLGLCQRQGHGRVGRVGLPRCPVLAHEAPELLVEGRIGEGPAAGGHAADILLPVAARGVLPPLVRKLEDEATDTAAARIGGTAVGHDLARERRRRLRLRLLVLRAREGVVGVGAVLAQEHRQRGAELPLVEDATEGYATVHVQAPEVDVGQACKHLRLRQVSVDR